MAMHLNTPYSQLYQTLHQKSPDFDLLFGYDAETFLEIPIL